MGFLLMFDLTNETSLADVRNWLEQLKVLTINNRDTLMPFIRLIIRRLIMYRTINLAGFQDLRV